MQTTTTCFEYTSFNVLMRALLENGDKDLADRIYRTASLECVPQKAKDASDLFAKNSIRISVSYQDSARLNNVWDRLKSDQYFREKVMASSKTYAMGILQRDRAMQDEYIDRKKKAEAYIHEALENHTAFSEASFNSAHPIRMEYQEYVRQFIQEAYHDVEDELFTKHPEAYIAYKKGRANL